MTSGIGWQLLQFMAMRNNLANYTYLPLSERQRRIDAMPNIRSDCYGV